MEVLVYKNVDVVFQEVPNEISLAFSMAGCPFRCVGCHSPELWTEQKGKNLTLEVLESYLQQYNNLITCVLFMGGEWKPDGLLTLIDKANEYGLKTCLYTGADSVPDKLMAKLNYLKTGQWLEQLGGLSSPTTNQTFINVKTGENLAHLFRKI